MKDREDGRWIRAERPGDRRAPRRAIPAIALLAAVALCSMLQAAEPSAARDRAPSPLLEGLKVFRAKGCDRCHGTYGSPEEHAGPDLIADRSWQDLMEFSGTLWNHVPRMLRTMRERGLEPPKIAPDEMEKLVEYVFYLSFLDEAGDAERGRRLFTERSCARCHQVGGRGGTVGPRLDELAPHATALFMAQALWSHGPEMGGKMAELGLDWPRLGPGDLRDLLAFLRGTDASAPSLEQAAAECGNPRLGKTLFELRGCAGCHGLNGDGSKIGPDLGTRRWRDFADMAGALWNHGPAMWSSMRERGMPLAAVGEGEMAHIAAYLFYVQFTAQGGDVARGERLFGDKTCVACHAAGGDRSNLHRDLARSDAARSSVAWASAMWNHAPAMEQTLQETGIAWPRFEPGEMRDLVAFLRARRAAELRGEP